MPPFAIVAGIASSLTAFVSFMILLNVFLGASLASSVVMLAELLPIARRADGQSWGGLAATLGGGLCVLIVPILEDLGLSWRWLLAVPTVVIAILPFLLTIPETAEWQKMSSRETTRRAGFQGVFGRLYRRRSTTIIIAGLILAFANEGITSYAYFHAVSDVRLSADLTSAFTIIGGGIGMLGFPLGAWTAERFGRVPTIAGFAAATAVSALGYYWGPPNDSIHPALWLGIMFLLWNGAINAVLVASNAAATELFPAALRGTIIGWFALVTAIGGPAAEATIALLAAHFGGIAQITGWLGLLGFLGAALYVLGLDESRGLPLETASKEVEFYSGV
jgi:MFS family permease